jgi:xylulokinase
VTLVAGIDSSTQSCKVVVWDTDTGHVVREGRASHPAGTEVDPEAWWEALQSAIAAAGGLDDVGAASVGGQQHGMVCLDAHGAVVRPALLWNDTRSAQAARDLVDELGPAAWAEATGSVPVASFTVTKLRWLADHEPEHAARVAAIALPHDWLTWRLRGTGSITDLTTDRSDASGTGYWSAATDDYRRDLLALALRRPQVDDLVLPRVLGPHEAVGDGPLVLGPGCGDNAGAALGLGLAVGDVLLSVGTSGVVAAVSASPTHDESGGVAGFADATGRHLPLAATLNGSRVLDSAARLLGVDHEQLAALALSAPIGSDGLVYVPYLEGERTPNLPDATGSLHGMTLASLTRENLARAAFEGLLCLLAGGVDAIRRLGVEVEQVTLVGGAAQSTALRQLAPAVLGVPVRVPPPAEYVALGAARQAAWVLSGDAEPPAVALADTELLRADSTPQVLDHYREVAEARGPRTLGD